MLVYQSMAFTLMEKGPLTLGLKSCAEAWWDHAATTQCKQKDVPGIKQGKPQHARKSVSVRELTRRCVYLLTPSISV